MTSLKVVTVVEIGLTLPWSLGYKRYTVPNVQSIKQIHLNILFNYTSQ